jgi:hypothetical protein
MFNMIKDLTDTATGAISSAANSVGAIVTGKEVQNIAEWVQETAATVGGEAARLGSGVIESDLVQDASKGAIVGAVIAVPLPIIRPAIGASIGASLGVYKNLTQPKQPSNILVQSPMSQIDFHQELLNLDDLKQKGIISDDEFDSMKKRVLEKYQL